MKTPEQMLEEIRQRLPLPSEVPTNKYIIPINTTRGISQLRLIKQYAGGNIAIGWELDYTYYSKMGNID